MLAPQNEVLCFHVSDKTISKLSRTLFFHPCPFNKVEHGVCIQCVDCVVLVYPRTPAAAVSEGAERVRSTSVSDDDVPVFRPPPAGSQAAPGRESVGLGTRLLPHRVSCSTADFLASRFILLALREPIHAQSKW